MGDTRRQRETAIDNFNQYALARDLGHTQFLEKDRKCKNYFVGNQWEEPTLNTLRQQGRPALTINMVMAKLITVMGQQIALQSEIRFVPTESGDPDTAATLTKLYKYITRKNRLTHLESQMAASGFISSRGYLDVRVEHSTGNMHGEVVISYRPARDVVLDPDMQEYDPDEWKQLFLTRWLSTNDIELLYGREFARELAHRPASGFRFSYDTLSEKNWFRPNAVAGFNNGLELSKTKQRFVRTIERQYKEVRLAEHFVDPATGDVSLIPGSWDRERIGLVMERYGLQVVRLKTERIRWTVSADDILLHDSESPYRHFTIVPYFPIFIEGYTMGLGEQLLSPQDMLNKTASQELHVVNTTANSGWQMEDGQLVNMTPEELEQKGSQTGLVLVRQHGSPPLEKITPNQIPQGLDRLSFKANEYLTEISGIGDSQRGLDRADVAAKAIQAKQQAGLLNLTMPFDNLSYTRRILARNVLDLIQEFYTAPRVLNVVTEGGLEPKTEQIQVNQVDESGAVLNDLTVGKYDVALIETPLRETYRQTQFEEAKALREMGLPIPDEFLISTSSLDAREQIIEQIQQSQQDSGQLQQQLQQLEAALKQAQVSDTEASALMKKADAVLRMARAQTEVGKDPAEDRDIKRMEAELDHGVRGEEVRRKWLELAAQLSQMGIQFPGPPGEDEGAPGPDALAGSMPGEELPGGQ